MQIFVNRASIRDCCWWGFWCFLLKTDPSRFIYDLKCQGFRSPHPLVHRTVPCHGFLNRFLRKWWKCWACHCMMSGQPSLWGMAGLAIGTVHLLGMDYNHPPTFRSTLDIDDLSKVQQVYMQKPLEHKLKVRKLEQHEAINHDSLTSIFGLNCFFGVCQLHDTVEACT